MSKIIQVWKVNNYGKGVIDGSQDFFRITPDPSTNGGGDLSSLIKQEFTYTSGGQVFTLSEVPSAIYAVFVNGQELTSSQYSISTDQLTIIDTLEGGDSIGVLFSGQPVGVNPSYTKIEVDELLANATITVELIDDLSVDFYATDDLKINDLNVIVGSGTITIEVNDSAYTLENLISQGDKITVNATTESVVNLEVRYE